MKTLSKKITLRFIKDQESYQRLCADWAQRMKNREELPAKYHLLYLVLRGKDWRKGFKTPSDTPARVIAALRHDANYADREWSCFYLFKDYLTANALAEVVKYLPLVTKDCQELPEYNLVEELV